MENCVDYSTEGLVTYFNDVDSNIFSARNRRVVTSVYRAVLKDHNINDDALAAKRAELKVNKYLKKQVADFADIDIKTYEPSTFDYWKIEEFQLKDRLEDLVILTNLSKVKKLFLDVASPTEISGQNQVYILKNLPTSLRELSIRFSFTDEIAQTLMTESQLPFLEVLDLSEAKNVCDEMFVDKSIHLPRLQVLNLNHCNISSKSLASILDFLTPFSLKKLYLNRNDLGLAGVILLAKTKKLTKLEELYLDDIGINYKALMALFGADFKSLRKLSIKGNSITNEAFKVAGNCKFSQALTSLSISKGVDEEIVRALFPKLKELEII
jgi:hypothetical protein